MSNAINKFEDFGRKALDTYEGNLLTKLVNMLADENLRTKSIACLCNILHDAQREETYQLLKETPILDYFKKIFQSKSIAQKRDCMLALNNIVYDGPGAIAIIMDSTVFYQIVICALGKNEALTDDCINFYITLVSACDIEQLELFIDSGPIQQLTDIIDKSKSSLLIVTFIKFITTIAENLEHGKKDIEEFLIQFQEFGGTRTLEDLQHHPNKSVYDASEHFLKTYYPNEDEDVDGFYGNNKFDLGMNFERVDNSKADLFSTY